MGPASVLIIANPFEAKVMSRAVDPVRYRCTVAEEGEGALDRLRSDAPDIVVLARDLFAVEDATLLEALRRHRPAPALVVIDDGSEGWPPPDMAHAALLARPIDALQLGATLARLAAAKNGQRSSGNEPSGMLRLDDALDLSALGSGSRGPWPLGAARPGVEPARAAPERASAAAVDHLALDSLPGIDDELGLGLRSQVGANELAVAAQVTLPALRTMARAAAEPAAPATLRDVPVAPERVADIGDAGELGREGLASILARLHRAGYTGRLTLRQGESEKVLFFDGGLPVHATSSLAHDRLGELLWREGKVSREQLSRAHVLADERAVGIVEALVAISALRRDEVFQTMRHLVEEIVYSSFAWDRAVWSLDRGVARRADMVSVAHPYALVLEGVRRKYSLERLVHALGPVSTTVTATASLWRVSADAGLQSGEREAVQQLRRGSRTLAELRSASGLDEIGAYALVYGLAALGAVEPGGESAAGENHSESADAAAAPVVHDEGGGDRDRERALAKHAQVLEGDYFAVLGTTRAASTYEIRRAYERARSEFAPERYAAPLREELAARLAEISEAVDEAWRALSDERLREVYRSHLAS